MDCVAPPSKGDAAIRQCPRADSWLLRGMFDRPHWYPSRRTEQHHLDRIRCFDPRERWRKVVCIDVEGNAAKGGCKFCNAAVRKERRISNRVVQAVAGTGRDAATISMRTSAANEAGCRATKRDADTLPRLGAHLHIISRCRVSLWMRSNGTTEAQRFALSRLLSRLLSLAACVLHPRRCTRNHQAGRCLL